MDKWHCTINDKKYGPVSTEELRRWVAEGRLRPADYVWCEGMVDWAPYNTIAELNYAAAQQAQVQAPITQTNGLAVAGMVLGIISVAIFCLWPISLICAIVGLCLSVAGKSRAEAAKTGNGMAVAGIALSCIALALVVVMFLVWLGMIGNVMRNFPRHR